MTGFSSKREAAKAKMIEQESVKLNEPVISAWSLREVYFDDDGEPSMHRSPPAAQRPWVGLTDTEIDYQAKKDDHGVYFALGALWAEAKLKERNNG